MADKKISQLTALSAANLAPSTDVLAIVDTSATETKKIVAQDLINGVLNVASAVGIGTASPAGKLDVQAANAGQGIRLTSTTGTNGVSYKATNSAGNVYFGIDTSTGGSFGNANAALIWYDAAQPLIFATNNTKRLTLDSSGNLGLGVTPSAWGSSWKVFQSQGGFVGSNATSGYFISNNSYSDGTNWRRVSAEAASQYLQSAGAHSWYSAGSSTAGSTISFTQAMTLDASANLLVGTTSSTGISGAAFKKGATTACLLEISGNNGTPATDSLAVGQGADNLGYVYQRANAALIFGTNNTERGRFGSDGQFQVASSLAGSNLLNFSNSSATGYGISVSVNNNSSGTYRYFEGVDSGPTQRIAIYTNGDVKNTNGVFAAFSDVKLKKDIVDAGSQWDDIKALRVRKYKLKDDAENAVQIGLIAQEVEQVSPGLVNESQDEIRDEDGKIVLTGEVTKGVKYSILYMKAVKALQEAMARIESLEVKVAALEAK